MENLPGFNISTASTSKSCSLENGAPHHILKVEPGQMRAGQGRSQRTEDRGPSTRSSAFLARNLISSMHYSATAPNQL